MAGVEHLVQGAAWEHLLESMRLSEHTAEWLLIAISVLAAAIGILFALRAYLQSPSIATRLQQGFGGAHRLLLNKYWVDELYDTTVVRPIHGFSKVLWRFWDEKVVDGIVNGVGVTFEALCAVLRVFQTGFVGTYATFFALGVLALIFHFVRH
jgi:NADH-quinone oxidoreductase subunit L